MTQGASYEGGCKYPMRTIIVVVALISVAVGGAVASAADREHSAEPAAGAGDRSSEQLEQAVERRLREDRALHGLEVSVAGNDVTLAGTVQSLWDKNEAQRRALDTLGVGNVVSEIDVPVGEDQRIADEVGKAIYRYPFYTIWDEIGGRVDNGVVTLSGRVTPGRDKARELFERIAKVPGVQGVEMDIRMLSPSSGDARIRYIIARRLVTNSHFERFRTMRNPPFHIIVNNSIVTLIGYVQGEIERIELQRVVAQTPGVLRVENHLQARS